MKIEGKQKQELILAWCFAVPVVIVLTEIHTKFTALGMHTGGGEQNAALFPKLLSFILLFLILLKTAEILLKARRNTEPDPPVEIFRRRALKRMGLMFIVFTAYLLGLTFLGYYASTPLALAAFLLLLNVRKPAIIILMSIGTTVFVWFAFSVLLKIVLPVGRLGLYF